jgi:hypothetical protein
MFHHMVSLFCLLMQTGQVTHVAVGGKADLILFRDVLVDIRDKVAALKKQGKSLPEVIAAKSSARYDPEWGNLFQNPSNFIALVYQGV